MKALVPFFILLAYIAAGGLALWITRRLLRARHRSAGWSVPDGELAFIDYLTGLPNRRALALRLEQLAPDGPLCMALLDLNDLKYLNDTQGHAAGDRMLRRLGGVLKEHCGDTLAAYRVGGDEFVLLGEGMPREEAERFFTGLQAMLCERGLNAALGWAWGLGADAQALMEESDRRMYADKKARKQTT